MKTRLSIASQAVLSIFIVALIAHSVCFADILTIRIPSGEWTLDQGHTGGDTINAPDFGRMQIPGKPVLPSRIFNICMPPDARVTGVTFDADPKSLDGSYNIEPGALVLPAREITKAEFEAAKKLRDTNYDLIYSSDDPYPSQAAVYLGVGGLRKYKLVRIRYSPWQYRPKSMRIIHIPEVAVNIEYERQGTLEKHVKLYDRAKEDRAQQIVYNYADAREWYPEQQRPAGAGDYKYIIMCTEATESAVEVLADWKRSIGMRVHVFTKEWLEANTNYPDYELERQIRYYLRDNYLTWNAEYFLIVAHNDVIPMRVCDPAGDGSIPCETDTYYGELSDIDSYSWDDDWDGRYAEWDDDYVDWLIELDVGRIPDNDPAIVQAICEKIRSFEMDTGTWKKRGLMLGAIWNYDNENGEEILKTDSAYLMEEMMNDWSWPGWSLYPMYEHEGLDPSVFFSVWPLDQVMVVNAWDDGQYSLVNMAGHGAASSIFRTVWDHDDGDWIPRNIPGDFEVMSYPFFDRSDVPSLNSSHPSIVFFAGCSCGHRNYENAVAKEVLHTGAVSTIAASTDIAYMAPWYDENGGLLLTLQYHYNKYLIHHAQKGGTALTSAKEFYPIYFFVDAAAQQLLLSMNYFGDPALIRSGTILRPNLDYYYPADWYYVTVPRSTNDATSTWCPVSSTLPGNANSTYLNFGIENNGNVTAYSVYNRLYIDDVYVRWVSWGWIGSGAQATFTNAGPHTVKGGRHTLKVVYDPLNETTESNESDNVWQRQYVWSPHELTNQVPVWRTAPPDEGSGTYYNCDGFSAEMGVGEFWCAVGILPYDEDDNYDIRLHTDYTGSTNGFDTYHKWSADPGDRTDFCIINRNQTGYVGPYYFGVIKRSGGDNGFRIQQANSGATLSTTAINGPFTIHGWDAVDMHEIYLTPATWKIRLEIDSGYANLGLSIYDKSGSYFSKGNYMPGGYSNSGGDGEDESFNISITESGWYGIAVWKVDSSDYGYLTNYYLGISQDMDCPTPNPMTWSVTPHATGADTIAMTASTATDPSGVEYFFEFMGSESGGTGGDDSGWQASNAYTDSGLGANEYYSYRVIARDMSPVHNETAPSSTEAAATWIETPAGIKFAPWISSTSMLVKSSNTPSNLTAQSSGLIIECTTLGTDTGWKQDNDWWEVSSLTPNTSYGFRAKARNREGVETVYCTTTYRYTLAAVPGSDDFSNVTTTSIQANWNDNGNPAGTEYFCTNMTTSQTSGWITDLYWVCGGLTPETSYFFKVMARNFDGLETSWCFLGAQMTAFIDSDGDGLPDSWEQQIIDDDPDDDIESIWDVSPDDDYDGDGSTNEEEFCANTDPTDDQSFFAIINIVRGPSTVSVFWKCVAGAIYRVEYCDEEMDPGITWLTAQDGIAMYAPGVHVWTDDGSHTGTPPANVPHRYYRVMVYGPCGN